MNDYIAYELAKVRHADLLGEAAEYRRAAAARPARPAATDARATSRFARLLRRAPSRRSPAYR